MTGDVVKVELLDDETLDGAKTHHLVLHGEDAAVGLWIDSED